MSTQPVPSLASTIHQGLKDENLFRGAIMLRGYLADAVPGTPRRLYSDNSFRCWYEFIDDDLLHVISGGTDPCCPMDAVWIKREAPITKTTAGYAYVVAQSEEMMDGDDPAGGPYGKR